MNNGAPGLLLACVLALGLLVPPVAVSTPAQAQVSINIQVGTDLNRGRRISCSDGERLLRARGYRDVRRIDCRGRYFVYRAWRGNNRFEIALSASTGRVVDYRWLHRRR
jgi:hypothetical protein